MNYFVLFFVIIFVALMFGIGIVVSKKVEDSDDFFVGGRKIPTFLVIATLLASEVGGGVMLGSVGYGYSSGWGALWYLAPMAIGLMLFGLVMAKRLKRDGDRYGYSSMFEWLSGRFYNIKSIRLIGAVVILVGFVGCLASQFVAMGTALSSIVGVDKRWGLIIGGIVVVIYASLGGLLSVMWTDLLQAAVFVFGMVVLLPMLINQPNVGGINNLLKHISNDYPSMWSAGTIDWRLGMLVTMSVAPFVRQYYYQRMFAAQSERKAQVSVFVQAALLVVIAVWTVLIGAGINMLNPNLENPEVAMPWVIGEIFSPIVGAIILSAIVACIMSTADTFVNAASLTFVKDIVAVLFEKEKNKKRELWIARVSSIMIGIIALILAMGSVSVMNVIQKAWSILGGGLFCPMIISYFWKRSSKIGVLMSMILGFISTLYSTYAFSFNAIFVGGPISLASLIVFSLLFKDKTTVDK